MTATASEPDELHTKQQAEHAMQWALEDLLTHGKDPSSDLLVCIPQGEAKRIIDHLIEALHADGLPGARRAFSALAKTYI